MKINIGRKRKRTFIIALTFFLLLLILFSTGKHGFIQQIRVQHERKRLVQENKRLQAEKQAKEEEKEKLNDPEYVEKVAREEYGMAKENEKVYRVVPKEKK